MADDGRTYIRVHDGMPDHPKVDALSDKAFRLLVSTWCWCSRHLTDGRIPRATWARRGTPAARRELVAAGLVEDHGADGVQMHDYLEHQRSRAEVEEISESRRAAQQKASIKGNHNRWHRGPNGKPSEDCELCQPGSQGDTDGIGSGIGSGIPKGSLIDTDRDREKEQLDLAAPAAEPNARTNAAAAPRRPREHATAAELNGHATSPAGYRLVQAWAESNPGLTSGKRRELGKAVDKLLAQGADPELIPDALDAAHHTRFRNPAGALPHAYDDVRRARNQPVDAAPIHPTDARIQALLQGPPTGLPPAIGGPS